MSPEQASGDDSVDARSDIYSLGAVMYYMLTGQPPFMSDNPLKVMIAHASQEVVPPRQINPESAGRAGRDHSALPGKGSRAPLPGRGRRCSSAMRELALDETWSSDLAAEWWSCNGCPERKKMAAELVEAAAV